MVHYENSYFISHQLDAEVTVNTKRRKHCKCSFNGIDTKTVCMNERMNGYLCLCLSVSLPMYERECNRLLHRMLLLAKSVPCLSPFTKKKLHDGTALFRGRRRRRHTPTRRSGWDGFDGSFPNTRLGFGFFLGFRLTRRRYRLVITGEASVLALGVLLILKGPFACLVVIVKGEVAFDGHLFAIRREGIW